MPSPLPGMNPYIEQPELKDSERKWLLELVQD